MTKTNLGVTAVLFFFVSGLFGDSATWPTGSVWVLIDSETGQVREGGTLSPDQRFSPCSTFKILNTIISLREDPPLQATTLFLWDGAIRFVPSWNRDLTLKEAFQSSAYWVYQILARRNGREAYSRFFLTFPYGNMDINGPLTGFWQNSSLQVSVREQALAMQDLFGPNSPLSDRERTLLNELMIDPSVTTGHLYGKTGSGFGTPQTFEPYEGFEPVAGVVLTQGWYVGFYEGEAEHRWYFAAFLRGVGAQGRAARDIILQALRSVGLPL